MGEANPIAEYLGCTHMPPSVEDVIFDMQESSFHFPIRIACPLSIIDINLICSMARVRWIDDECLRLGPRTPNMQGLTRKMSCPIFSVAQCPG